MSKTTVRGVTKFREFNSGNVIKVTLTNNQELRGLYVGDVVYKAESFRRDRVTKGHFMIIYNVKERKPEVINVLQHCQLQKTHIQEVGSTRLKKELSDYLRAYHKEYEKYQKQQKLAVEAIEKSEDSEGKLQEVVSGKLPKELQKAIEEDYYQQNPKEHIKDKILEGTGFSGYQQSEGVYHLEKDLGKFKPVYSEDLGASTYLEYDDTRHVDRGVDQQIAERYLNSKGYSKISYDQYRKLVNKHKNIATFSKGFIGMDIGEGNRVYPTIEIRVEIKDMNKVKLEQIDSLVNDLKILYKQVTYFKEVRRRVGFW